MGNGSVRVLAVDNNDDVCRVLETVIRDTEGLEWVGASHDGIDALERIKAERPDVVLLDIVIPYMDGLEVLSRIPSLGLERRPGVIVMSAFEDEELVRRASKLGADYYLLKPFGRETLVKRVFQVAESGRDRRTAPVLTRHEPLPSKDPAAAGVGSGGEGHSEGTVRSDRPAGDRSPARGPASGDVAAKRLEDEVTRVLYNLGVPTYFKGYPYLRDAIVMVTSDISYLGAVTKSLYPRIAEKHGTTPLIVEAAIRYTIQKTWKRGNPEYIRRLFGYAVNLRGGKAPTNSFFIAKVAEVLRLGMLEGARV